MAKMAFETAIGETFPLERLLSELDILVRGKALEAALKAASKIVSDEASRRISRSSTTKTADKKSQKQKRADATRKPLADSIAVKIIRKKNDSVFIAVTGQKLEPSQKGGRKRSVVAHSHLLEFGHRGVFWKRSNWQFGSEKQETGFRYRLRADGTRRTDERRIRFARAATLVGGNSRKDFVEAKKWLAPAVDTTLESQQMMVIEKLDKAIRRQHRQRGGKNA